MVFHRVLGLLLGISSLFSAHASEQTLFLWEQNFKFPQNIALLKLALERAEEEYGKIEIKAASASSLIDAFSTLELDETGFDAVISAVDLDREGRFLPVYVPLNRGLLGFRLCLINPNQQSMFDQINAREDFSKFSVSITQGKTSPDVDILEFNTIDVVVDDTDNLRIENLINNTAQCYSRSLIEVGHDLDKFDSVALESSLMLVYPLADIIYFRQGAQTLKDAIEYGLQALIEDGSYMEEFYSAYAEIFEKYRIYERKLLLLPHPSLSEKARSAINNHGLASFMALEIEVDSD